MDIATTFSGAGLTNDTAFAGTATGETITAGSGDDILLGNGGNDTLLGNDGDDWLVGGQGNDTINAGTDGTDGDTIAFVHSPAGIAVDLGANYVSNDGWGTSDTLTGIENVEGADHNDTICGDAGINTIEGRSGADTLWGGGGNDRFVYRSESDSGTAAGTRDYIGDINAGTNITTLDQIDISALLQGTFSYLGATAFSANAGNTQARFENNGDGTGLKLLEIDTDGDATANLQIQLDSSFDAANLDAGDFKTTNPTV